MAIFDAIPGEIRASVHMNITNCLLRFHNLEEAIIIQPDLEKRRAPPRSDVDMKGTKRDKIGSCSGSMVWLLGWGLGP